MSQRFILYFFGSILLLIGLLIVFSSPVKKFTIYPISFFVKENDEIRFKNLNAFYYNKADIQNQNKIIYTHTNLNESPIKLKIVLSVLEDEAFILFDQMATTDSLFIQNGVKKDTLIFNSLESNFVSAAKLFQFSQEKFPFLIFHSNDTIHASQLNTKLINKILKDYFKLVGKIN